MFAKEFFCSGCLKTFRVVSGMDRMEAPCPACGTIAKPNEGQNKAVFVKGENGKISAIINGVVRKAGSFKCRDCSHSFVFDESAGNKAGCPRCRSTNCEPTSPSAFVMTGSRVQTKRVEKRTRYMTETWKTLTQLRKYREGLRSFMEALSVRDKTKEDALSMIDKVIEEVDADRKAKISEYDKVKS
jgi:DNA-directed RNA polymerase subunit RPC12/RpoP